MVATRSSSSTGDRRNLLARIVNSGDSGRNRTTVSINNNDEKVFIAKLYALLLRICSKWHDNIQLSMKLLALKQI